MDMHAVGSRAQLVVRTRRVAARAAHARARERDQALAAPASEVLARAEQGIDRWSPGRSSTDSGVASKRPMSSRPAARRHHVRDAARRDAVPVRREVRLRERSIANSGPGVSSARVTMYAPRGAKRRPPILASTGADAWFTCTKDAGMSSVVWRSAAACERRPAGGRRPVGLSSEQVYDADVGEAGRSRRACHLELMGETH
jgi:hypothetical protein